MDLTAVLDQLRKAQASKAKVTFKGEDISALEVEFFEAPTPVTPFVDAKGNPIDLDAGLPPLARDPDGAMRDDEPSDAAIERANFKA